MTHGIIGGVLGLAIAFVLETLGLDYWIIDFMQDIFVFDVTILHFYGLFGLLGAVAGFLPW